MKNMSQSSVQLSEKSPSTSSSQADTLNEISKDLVEEQDSLIPSVGEF
jgi:hypothetical protein